MVASDIATKATISHCGADAPLPQRSPATSIANVICDAVGVRIIELPITRERILKALKAKRGE